MSENRIDPTVAGLFLTAFIALIFGFLGIEAFSSLDWGLMAPALGLAPVIGIAFIVLTVSAIRSGNAFATSLFAFVAIALIMVPICLMTSWFAFVIAAIFFIVFALIAFLVGAPKLLAIMLFFIALLYLFVGLSVSPSTVDAFSLLYGIFGLLGGVLALYLAFALSTEKLPVF
ncbi:MAG: hypothetical protein FWD81_03810 [Methanomassiliicoccaceae archaeon]|nr:hypothetical protein [Methanomassiliicoccaceae archaeon]